MHKNKFTNMFTALSLTVAVSASAISGLGMNALGMNALGIHVLGSRAFAADSAVTASDWPQAVAVEAPNAILMDADTGTVLYSKGAETKAYPASNTKIMTALVALENCSLTDEIKYTYDMIYYIGEGGSNGGIKEGEVLTVEESLYDMLLGSANECANGVAVAAAGGINSFISLMNTKAAELGCTNTNFANTHGYHADNHYTCAYDMALVLKAACENPDFVRIASTVEYTLPETNMSSERTITNRDDMLLTSSEYYDEDVVLGKTGYTSAAQNTLATYAERDGMSLICIVMNCSEKSVSYDSTKTLLDYGFDNFARYDVADSSVGSSLDKSYIENCTGLGENTSAFSAKDVTLLSGKLTLPSSVSIADVSSEGQAELDESGEITGINITYTYEGQKVGTAKARVVINTVVESTTAAEKSSGFPIHITLPPINTTTLLIGGGILALIIILIIILVATREVRARWRRIRHRRKKSGRRLF